MSEKLTGIVFAHADLAQAIVSAVQAIAGRPALIFADMPGGSCAFSAAAFARGRAAVRVVTGVNLAMLLDFAFHRDLAPAEAAARACETGRGSVTLVGGGA